MPIHTDMMLRIVISFILCALIDLGGTNDPGWNIYLTSVTSPRTWASIFPKTTVVHNYGPTEIMKAALMKYDKNVRPENTTVVKVALHVHDITTNMNYNGRITIFTVKVEWNDSRLDFRTIKNDAYSSYTVPDLLNLDITEYAQKIWTPGVGFFNVFEITASNRGLIIVYKNGLVEWIQDLTVTININLDFEHLEQRRERLIYTLRDYRYKSQEVQLLWALPTCLTYENDDKINISFHSCSVESVADAEKQIGGSRHVLKLILEHNVSLR